MSEPVFPERAPTGLPGLDHILGGGLPKGEVYLVQGKPGTGKTTLGLQFLHKAEDDERVLYITLSQTRRTLQNIARSHGWSLDQFTFCELIDILQEKQQVQTVFPSWEIELEEMTQAIREAIDDEEPTRVVIDAVSDLRTVATSSVRFRRELLALRHYLHACGCTTLLLDEPPTTDATHELENQAHGILALRQQSPEYGEVRRRLQVLKLRGTPFMTGYHNFRIVTGGLEVYPRVQANGASDYDTWEVIPSGIRGLDDMLGGGLRKGTSCLIAGPTGSGKTSLGFQMAVQAALDGRPATIFLFDERVRTFKARAESMAVDLDALTDSGALTINQINTGTITPSEFAQRVREAVDAKGAEVVFLDSLTGYINAMQQDKALITQLHELLTFLSQHGVLTLLVVAQHGRAFGTGNMDPTQLSYMSDSVLLLRYNEHMGRLQRSISILKQRHGAHDEAARELFITSSGIDVGRRLDEYVGLTLDTPLTARLHPPSAEHAVSTNRE